MNEEYIDNVKHLIEQKDADKVKGLLIDLHPADIAELCNDLNAEEAKFVYRLLDNEIAADVLVEMDEDARKEHGHSLQRQRYHATAPGCSMQNVPFGEQYQCFIHLLTGKSAS